MIGSEHEAKFKKIIKTIIPQWIYVFSTIASGKAVSSEECMLKKESLRVIDL